MSRRDGRNKVLMKCSDMITEENLLLAVWYYAKKHQRKFTHPQFPPLTVAKMKPERNVFVWVIVNTGDPY